MKRKYNVNTYGLNRCIRLHLQMKMVTFSILFLQNGNSITICKGSHSRRSRRYVQWFGNTNNFLVKHQFTGFLCGRTVASGIRLCLVKNCKVYSTDKLLQNYSTNPLKDWFNHILICESLRFFSLVMQSSLKEKVVLNSTAKSNCSKVNIDYF